ncbi:hypothetical protein [Sphingomicrobium nitratireducens]|uniref:hypothetical protein n=1 Tax=Sphingomicrobium nitratireducens TaxID=2964666 RepID=UPI0022409947|nr:hypothetical protein [Sphingomicrobium nitratireducens]
MAAVISGLFFFGLFAAMTVAILAMLGSSADKMLAAFRGDSLVANGAARPVVVTVQWKSRGEAPRAMLAGATPRLRAAA